MYLQIFWCQHSWREKQTGSIGLLFLFYRLAAWSLALYRVPYFPLNGCMYCLLLIVAAKAIFGRVCTMATAKPCTDNYLMICDTHIEYALLCALLQYCADAVFYFLLSSCSTTKTMKTALKLGRPISRCCLMWMCRLYFTSPILTTTTTKKQQKSILECQKSIARTNLRFSVYGQCIHGIDWKIVIARNSIFFR